MTKPALVLGSGCFFFLAGLLSGLALHDPVKSEKPIKQGLASVDAGRHLASQARQLSGHAQALKGQPVPKQLRSWLYHRLANEWRDWDGNAAIYYSVISSFLTLDADSSEEAFRELINIDRKFDAHDPHIRSLVKSKNFSKLFMEPILVRLSQLNPTRALDLVESTGQPQEFVDIVINASIANGASPLSLVGDPANKQFPLKLYATIAALAKARADDAVALLQSYPNKEYEKHRLRLVTMVSAYDPGKAVQIAAGLSSGSPNSDVLRVALGEWADSDPKAALKWASSFEGEGKAAAKAFVLVRNAADHTPEAIHEGYLQLVNQNANESVLGYASAALAAGMALKEPESAKLWIAKLPEGTPKDKAIEAVASELSKKDPFATSQWITTLPAGGGKTAATHQLITSITTTDPESAYVWASTLPESQERTFQRQEILRVWKLQNPEAGAEAELKSPP